MALNTKGILSNVKAQSQKLYKSVKGNLIEEGLLTNNVSKAIDKVSSSAKDGYDDTIKAINAVKKDMPIPNDPEQLYKDLQGIADEKDGSILGISKAMSEDQAKQVKDAASMRMVKKNGGLNSENNMEAYSGVLKSTKGAVAGNTAKGMIKDYYVNPVKELAQARKSGNREAANKALGKVVTRAGAVGGTVAGVSILSNYGDDDKDIMRY